MKIKYSVPFSELFITYLKQHISCKGKTVCSVTNDYL